MRINTKKPSILRFGQKVDLRRWKLALVVVLSW